MILPPLIRLLGLDQQEVAKAAGLNPSTLNRALRGKQRLSEKAIARVETALLEKLSRDGAS